MPTCPKCGHVFSEIPAPESTIFPWKIIFERSTDQGNGTAGILFQGLQPGFVTSVSVNGETAREGTPYKDIPVFLLTKSGENYSRPLQFIIKTSDGKTYTAKSGSGTTSNTGTSGKGTKFNLSSSADGYKTLRTSQIGTSFGSSIKFVYENGYVFNIPNTLKRYEEGNRITIYRCGGKGLSKSDERYTSHGGMGVWTKKAGSSSYVTIYTLAK